MEFEDLKRVLFNDAIAGGEKDRVYWCQYCSRAEVNREGAMCEGCKRLSNCDA